MTAGVSLEDFESNLHETLAALRSDGEIVWVEALGGWTTTTHNAARAVLADAATFTVDDPRFTTGQVLGPSMLSTDGATHRRHRDPFVRLFGRTRVRDDLHAAVAAQVDRHVTTVMAAMADLGRAELVGSFARPLAVGVIIDVLGLDASPSDVGAWYSAFSAAVGALSDDPDLDLSTMASTAALDTFRSHIGDARNIARRPEVWAGVGDLTGEELAADIGVIMFGAIETSEAMTANALWWLLRHGRPNAPEPTLAAIDESSRLDPGAAVVDRYATVDVELAGASITAGDFVQVSLAAANRDPALFDAPDNFDAARPDLARQMTWASGPHTCIGIHLARLETHLGVTTLLDRLPDLALDLAASAAPTGRIFRKPPRLTAT